MDTRSPEPDTFLQRSRRGLWYFLLCGLGAIWAVGFLVYGTLALIEWAGDGWSLHREFGRVIRILVAFILFGGGAAVALWSYSQTRTDRDRHAEPPEPETDAAGDADPDDLPN
ncbi:hypothetical protein SAMN05421759_104295 [Roseivivax lentus]|uniref:Uncharacterized protein n=1 Tax=Roseivivax lentus TaxID=633194 RepID=A0A1N7MG30_9RHOB|nr:hypothetical protein [Roseivivax lentus]SIS85096.1 hypothetical protein SAMN05421759_104295 [Roseivivax lentus]